MRTYPEQQFSLAAAWHNLDLRTSREVPGETILRLFLSKSGFGFEGSKFLSNCLHPLWSIVDFHRLFIYDHIRLRLITMESQLNHFLLVLALDFVVGVNTCTFLFLWLPSLSAGMGWGESNFRSNSTTISFCCGSIGVVTSAYFIMILSNLFSTNYYIQQN